MPVKFFLISLIIIFCSQGEILNISACAGKDKDKVNIHLDLDQYVIRYEIENATYRDLIFDQIVEIYSPTNTKAGLTLKKNANGTFLLESGEKQEFISNTKGSTIKLLKDAKGNPVVFYIVILHGDDVIYRSKGAILPPLEKLPQCGLDYLKNYYIADPDLKEKYRKMSEKMIPIKFNQ